MLRVKRVGQISSLQVATLVILLSSYANVNKLSIMSLPGFQADFNKYYSSVHCYLLFLELA